MTLRINAAHAERGLDPYWTPPEATRALLQIERLPQNNWEPACGNGAIAKVLRSAGRVVLSSDIARYDGFEPDFVADYLTAPVRGTTRRAITGLRGSCGSAAQRAVKSNGSIEGNTE